MGGVSEVCALVFVHFYLEHIASIVDSVCETVSLLPTVCRGTLVLSRAFTALGSLQLGSRVCVRVSRVCFSHIPRKLHRKEFIVYSRYLGKLMFAFSMLVRACALLNKMAEGFLDTKGFLRRKLFEHIHYTYV